MQLPSANRNRVVVAATSVMLALSLGSIASFAAKKAAPLPAIIPAPFSLVVPPNPRAKRAISAILPSASGLTTPLRDAGLARFAASQIARTGKWQRSSVFVIRNRKAMNLFRKLQRKNQNKTIDTTKFRDMTTVWNNTSLYYDERGGKARVFYPQATRLPWWKILR